MEHFWHQQQIGESYLIERIEACGCELEDQLWAHTKLDAVRLVQVLNKLEEKAERPGWHAIGQLNFWAIVFALILIAVMLADGSICS